MSISEEYLEAIKGTAAVISCKKQPKTLRTELLCRITYDTAMNKMEVARLKNQQ